MKKLIILLLLSRVILGQNLIGSSGHYQQKKGSSQEMEFVYDQIILDNGTVLNGNEIKNYFIHDQIRVLKEPIKTLIKVAKSEQGLLKIKEVFLVIISQKYDDGKNGARDVFMIGNHGKWVTHQFYYEDLDGKIIKEDLYQLTLLTVNE